MNLQHLVSRQKQSLTTRIHPLHLNINSEGESISEPTPPKSNLIITGSSDLGVVRNGGRRGSSFGAKAVLSQFKRLQDHLEGPIFLGEIADPEEELQNFDAHLTSMTKKWNQILRRHFGPIIHLGGGHDHIFSLAQSLLQNLKPKEQLAIINLDPHLDTRIDEIAHSGNPFRMLAGLRNPHLKIWQIGTQDFSNGPENFSGLQDLQMEIIRFSQIVEKGGWDQEHSWWQKFKRDIREYCLKHPTKILLSLDADGIQASQMEGVSAPGPFGLELREIYRFLSFFKKLPAEQKIFGIYEYNPLFDNLSCKGARAISQLMYQFMEES